MASRHREYEFDLTGGSLCLNLANTISRRGDPEREKERLESYIDLLAFARQSGIISAKQARDLQAYARHHGNQAERSLDRAIALREPVYRAFSAIAQGKSPTAADLSQINDFAVEALQHRCLSRANGGYRWEWQPGGKNPLERVLWPMAQSAADLLTSEQLRIVRWCEAADCQWLFLDHSRNHSRRWCDMKACGNRQKARRHYQRTREQG